MNKWTEKRGHFDIPHRLNTQLSFDTNGIAAEVSPTAQSNNTANVPGAFNGRDASEMNDGAGIWRQRAWQSKMDNTRIAD